MNWGTTDQSERMYHFCYAHYHSQLTADKTLIGFLFETADLSSHNWESI